MASHLIQVLGFGGFLCIPLLFFFAAHELEQKAALFKKQAGL
jgi:hypothetical protein